MIAILAETTRRVPDPTPVRQYEERLETLVDACHPERATWLKLGEQNIIGNLRQLPHDEFQLANYRFTVPDVDWMWFSREGFLVVELEHWRRVPPPEEMPR